MSADRNFRIQEATITDIHAAYRRSGLTACELVETHLDRIDAYKKVPGINSLTIVNPLAVQQAAELDAV
jgi:amidase